MIEVDLSRHKPVVVVTDVQELFTAAEGPFENTTSGPLLEALDAFLRGCRALALPVVFSNCTGAARWETEHDTYCEIRATWTAEVASAESVLACWRAA